MMVNLKNPNKPPFKLNSRLEIRDSKFSIINQNHDGDEGNGYKPKM